MRTLKKTLCLVLCVVMMAGLCMISTNAAFTDAEEITYTEAVDVLSGLGILAGIEQADGTYKFNPKGTLTREQAAKIITYVLGMKDIKADCTFADCANSWAKNEIAFCAAEGIINGTGDGNFNPTGELTGNMFAKMLLCAVGYDADYEGMTGVSWEVGVAKLLKKTAIADKITGYDGSKVITREEACQMAFAAIQLPTKDFKAGMNIAGLGLTITGTGEYGTDGASLASSVFKMLTASGVVDANAANTATVEGKKTTTVESVVYNIASGADLLGHYVTVYYKTTGAKGVAYAIVDKTVKTTVAKTATAKDVKAAFVASGYATDLDTTAVGADKFDSKFTNGAEAAADVVVKLGTSTGNDLFGKTFYGYYDATNKVMVPYGYAVADTLTAAKVAKVVTKAGYETITVGTTVLNNNATTDEVNEYEGIAAGDIVVYTNLNGVYNLTKTTKVEGKISKVVTTTGKESVTLDGTAYSKSSAFGTTVVTDSIALADIALGKSYVAYLDGAGKVVAVVGSADTNVGVVYLVDKYNKAVAGEYGNTVAYYIQGVDTNGEIVSYQVTEGEYNKACVAGTGNNPAKQLYKVTTAYNATLKATVATLNAVTGATVVVDNTATDNAAIVAKTTKKVGSSYFAADTQFFFVSGSKATLKVTAKTGVQDVDANKYVFYATKATASAANSTMKYVFVDSAAATATKGTGYVFVAADQNANSKVAYTAVSGAPATGAMVNVYIDGEAKEIMVASDAAPVAGFYTYTVEEANDLYTLTAATTANLYTGVKLDGVYGELLSWSKTGVDQNDVKATDVVVVNTVAKTAANYSYISTDLDVIVAENLDTDGRGCTCAVVTDTTKTPTVVTYVYITAADVTAED